MRALSRCKLPALCGALLSLAGCSNLADLYAKEVRDELAKPLRPDTSLITEERIARLPEPVKRYFRYAGWIGRKAPRNARVTWSDFRLKRAHGKPWMPLACRQFNSVAEPMRIAFMSGRLMKVLPFEGRDKYQDGHGHMLVKAMGVFTAVDEKSPRMDTSGLVTVLAEALMLPSYALQPWIRWEAVDSARARAVATWNGTTVDGVFHFAPTGESTRFETKIRWQQGHEAGPLPWSGYSGDYAEQDGIRFARGLRAAWHEPGGDFEYVQGRIERIESDVEEP